MISYVEGVSCYVVLKDEVKFFGKIRCVFSAIIIFDDANGRPRVISRDEIIRIHYFANS